MNHAARLEHLQRGRERPLLVSNLANLRYLTGFPGSSGYLAVWSDRAVFLTDGRYGELAKPLVAALPGTELVVYTSGLMDRLAEILDAENPVEVEAAAVTWDFARRLEEALGSSPLPATGLVEELRTVKDADEVAALRAAARAGDAAFADLGELVADGLAEADLGWRLIDAMRAQGATPATWEPIVAAGAGASVPHYRSGREPVGTGLLLLDYGCVVDGYHSDMSRTVWLEGDPDPDLAHVHEVVAAAQQAAIAAVHPGAIAGDIDAAARTVIDDAGFGGNFLHSTGHGVGLDIHEGPWIRAGSEDVVAAGTVFTIEPGIYLPGRGGVRIEDMILVTPDGPEELTDSPKELVRR